MRKLCRTLTVSIFAALLAAGTLTFADADARSISYDLNIPSEDLTAALQSFAIASHHKLLYKAELTAGKTSRALKGHFTAQEAMEALLSGTGLSYEITGSSVVLIKDQPGGKTSELGEEGVPSSPRVVPQSSNEQPIVLAQVDQGKSTSDVPESKSKEEEKKDGISEIVVTGTNIHGVTISTSPVQVYTAEDIARSGLATTEQFIQSLPQNFSGGISINNPDAIGAGPNYFNISGGSGANLRGLGNSSTLVLLNGQRLAPAGLGNFVDLSLIPVGVIDRVEVLSDGASAIYGSDAVGGVINIILRRNFDGAETQLRYGSVTNGGLNQLQFDQVFGKAWGTGSALISYDYSHQTDLLTSERSFTESVPSPTDLLPRQSANRVFGSATQDVSDWLHLSGDAMYSLRNTAEVSQNPTTELTNFRSQQFGGSLSALANLAGDLDLTATGNYNRVDSIRDQAFLPTPSAPFQSDEFQSSSSVYSADVKLDGTVFSLPGGPAKVAVGGDARRETYSATGGQFTSAGVESRNVYAAYGELLLPIVGGENRRPGLYRAQVSIAGRYEDYSDFGSTANPKLGALWSPIEDVTLRGSWGTSFRAPTFDELDANNFSALALPLPDSLSPSGMTDTMILQGNNANLTPERAKTWTAGLDWLPQDVKGLKLSASYFHINFTNMIAVPTPSTAAAIGALENASVYASIITRNPSLATIENYFANPNFFNLAGATPAEIGAILDLRLKNIATLTENGADFSISYSRDTTVGLFSGELAGTYTNSLTNQLTPTSPVSDYVGQIFFPPRLKMRNRISWSLRGVSLTGFINYTGSSADPRTTPSTPVASWTTVDATASYDGSASNVAWLRKTRIVLAAQNILNRDPPYVFSTGFEQGFNFDPTNANALGRFLSLQIVQKW